MSTNDVLKSIKNALSGKSQTEIMLNLNIKLRNFFEAEIIIFPLAAEAEMKNGVADKKSVLLILSVIAYLPVDHSFAYSHRKMLLLFVSLIFSLV